MKPYFISILRYLFFLQVFYALIRATSPASAQQERSGPLDSFRNQKMEKQFIPDVSWIRTGDENPAPWFLRGKFSRRSSIPLQPFGSQIAWVTRYQPESLSEYWRYIKCEPDSNGNLYTLHEQVSSLTGLDFYLRKYDHTGQLLWEHQFNGDYSGDDRALFLAVEKAENIYIAGLFPVNAYHEKLVFLKYNSTGQIIWSNGYLLSEEDENWIQIRPDASYAQFALIRKGGGTLSFKDGIYTTHQDSVIIIMCDSSGQIHRCVREGQQHPETIIFVISYHADAAGNLYLVVDKSDYASESDGSYIYKYSCDGVLKWQRKISDAQVFYGIAGNGAGEIGLVLSPDAYYPAKLTRIDSAGTILFETTVGSPNYPLFLRLDNENRTWTQSEKKLKLYDQSGQALWEISVPYLSSIAVNDGVTAVIAGTSEGKLFIRKMNIINHGTIWEQLTGSPVASYNMPVLSADPDNLILYAYGNLGDGAFLHRYSSSGILEMEKYPSASVELTYLGWFGVCGQTEPLIISRSGTMTKYNVEGIQSIRTRSNGTENFKFNGQGKLFSLEADQNHYTLTRWDSSLHPVATFPIMIDPAIVDWYDYALNEKGDFVFAASMYDSIWDDQSFPWVIDAFDQFGNQVYRRSFSLKSPHFYNLEMNPAGEVSLFTDDDIVYIDNNQHSLWIKSFTGLSTRNGTMDQWGNLYSAQHDYEINGVETKFSIQKIDRLNKQRIWYYQFDLIPDEAPAHLYANIKFLPDHFGRLLLKLRTNIHNEFDDYYKQYLFLLDQKGREIWKKDLDAIYGSGFSVSNIHNDSKGNFYITGVNQNLSKPEIFAISFDPEGNTRWQIMHSPSENYRSDLYQPYVLSAIDNAGNLYVASEFGGYEWRKIDMFKIVQTNEHDISTTISSLSLGPNIPNPFNSTTAIMYRLPLATPVIISVFDRQGRRVRRDDLGVRAAGENTYYFRGDAIASGVYYYQIKTDREIKTGKMVLVK